ncbi:MAG: hypothetical protein WBP41_13485 [Saprospiraceae bacterium]
MIQNLKILVFILSLGSICLSLHACNKDDKPTPEPVEDARLYKKNESPLGLPVNKWIKEWELFSMSRSCEEVTTLEAITIPGQNQSMVFLNGTVFTHGTADVTIHEDQSIFVPIVSILYSVPTCINNNFQIQSGQDPQSFLSQTVTTIIDGVDIDFVKLDGKEVENVKNYRYQTEMFNLTPNVELQHCLLLCYPGGELKTMEQGFYIVIKPLSPGTHLLDLFAKDTVFGVEFSSRFNITVL